jgi:DNA primase
LDGTHPYLSERGVDRATVDYFGVGYFAGRGLMEERIAIPIRDEKGKLVAYCGRALNNGVPRYLFPGGFAKSRVLFHYHRAVATESDEVLVVEGFFDCMRLHQAGYCNVVALMGSVLSPAQKELLVRRFGRIRLMLDGDAAGRAASGRIASELRTVCTVREVFVEPGRQPDQLTTQEIGRLLAEGGEEPVRNRD